MADIDDDYEAEQTELYALLSSLDDSSWSAPTPAAGWDVRDQVSHLAHTEEVAYDTAMGGPRSLANETGRYASGEEFTEAGCDQGRAMAPADVREWWWQAASRLRPALRGLADDVRVPWGLGMKRRSFVTARLMEHWAHGLDIRDAVGVEVVDTPRLRHVAWIGFSALPYAFGVAKVEPPAGRTLRLELAAPGGEAWT
nr:maleylpyruvate isomerase family mycothiol-dependent enzyme [Actinomycetota bacterium]